MISRQIGATLSAGSGPALRRLQAVDHLRLALGAEDRRALGALELADLRATPARRFSSVEQLAVDGVDLLAQDADLLARGRATVGAMRTGAPV